ncbi:WhiB family transcriptional regulator [Streptomyces sp. NBC_01497]|uniref:WhiB family transcriptional regulator n=1 Tax=Streptomyces sp. NBC_01497 TaxID=2903885 RepID=UPI002E30F3CF|nr:WhiB family transcriptional regulator [Streptomyces sp. NBC_01497]
MEWWTRAGCLGVDTDEFFPISARGLGRQQAERVKKICSRCRVRKECADWALLNREEYGIWGGLDEHERIVEIRRPSA